MAERNAEERGNRMTDIAATLLQGETPKTGEASQKEVNAVIQSDATDEQDQEQDNEDQSPDGGQEFEEEDDASDEDDQQVETEDDEVEEDETGGDETDYLDVRDDDLISVTVDGEEQEVSIGDLKRSFSGEGAIEKRLQDATETRKAAHAEATQKLEALTAQEQSLAQALDGLDDNLFKEFIPKPDENLRQSNPDRYLKHKEAYDQDQQRIQEARNMIEGKKKELEQQRQERLKQYAEWAGPVISQEIPELADPKTSQKAFNDLAETAQAYGYTQQEINNALDPRMFMLVRDAMRYRKLSDKTKERDPTDMSKQKDKKVRKLRSGNTQAKTRARQTDQQRKKAAETARKSGKPKDVAATLLVPKKG